MKILIVVFSALVFLGCSSLPRGAQEVFDTRNEAANFLRLGDGFFSQGQMDSAIQFYTEALRANQRVDFVEGTILARSSLGRAFLRAGRMQDAQRELNDAYFDATLLQEPAILGVTRNNLGELYYTMGNKPLALEFFTTALESQEREDNLTPILYHNLGILAFDERQFDQAQNLFTEALRLNRRQGNATEIGANLYMLAQIELRQQNIAAAYDLAQQALEADQRAENSPGIGDDLELLGFLSRRMNRYPQAFNYFRRALGVATQLDNLELTRNALGNLVELSQLMNDDELAARYRELLFRLPN